MKRQAAGISDDAVKARTGKSWSAWFTQLDRAGARKKSHREIVAHLHQQYRLGSWWEQMVTVAYERARLGRKKYQRPEGYAINRSKTVAVPLAKLWRAWVDGKARARWLKKSGLVIRKATPRKSLRITWVDGKTSVEVNFSARGAGKSQVAVEHNKLASLRQAEQMKALWAGALNRLQTYLEA